MPPVRPNDELDDTCTTRLQSGRRAATFCVVALIMENSFVLVVSTLLLADGHLSPSIGRTLWQKRRSGSHRDSITSPLTDAAWKENPSPSLFTAVARKYSPASTVAEELDDACGPRRRAE